MSDNKRDFEDIEIVAEAKEEKKEPKKSKKGKDKKPKKESKFKKKWMALKKWQRVVIIVVCVIVLLALIALATVYGVYNGFTTNIDKEDLGISDEIENKYGKTDVFNVAVFGVDTRDENSFKGLSDTIMIVSIDAKNKSVKIVSILRDSYVAIDGHKNQKITHAYSFGGAPLAIKTINENFNMNITDYATINMHKLADAINVLGGIDIEITESEMNQINQEALYGDPNAQRGAALVDHYGQVHLDGDQAVIFCRLRKQDSDNARSNRQKMVINALLTQARKVSPTKYAEVVKTMMSLCETSVSFSEVMSLVPLINEDVSIEAINIPGDPEQAIGGIYEGAWVWRYDLDAAAERIHMFIYGEPIPEAERTTTKKSTKNDSATKAASTTTTKKAVTTTKAAPATTAAPATQAPETTTAPVVTTTEPVPETTTKPSVPETTSPEVLDDAA